MLKTTFVDLFAGAGGLSYGLKQAGWQQMLACEHWGDAVQTYKQNMPDHQIFEGDIRSLTEQVISTFISDTPDWIVGGPPCQGYSTVGKRRSDDERNNLFQEFARVVNVLRPKNFLIENVLGMRDMSFVQPVCSYFRALGYNVSPFVLSAADFGVPQLRRRVFFVGSANGLFFDKPNPVLTEENWVTVADAIGDLPVLKSGEQATTYDKQPTNAYQVAMRHASNNLQGHIASSHPQYLVDAISHIPDGGNRTFIPAELQPKSGFHNSYSRLDSKKPAVAVTQNMGKPSGSRCIHPFQNRGLTAREGARLQGFPDRFQFMGGSTSQRLQIANAVSPILAKALALKLMENHSWCEAA